MTMAMVLGIALMLFLGTIASARGGETSTPSLEHDDPISGTLETIRFKRKVPALAVPVVLDGKIVAAHAVGFRKSGSPERVSDGDKFHVGSITKSMTATVAARLVEEGKISWTNSIGEIFHDFRDEIHPDYRGVTLEQLLAQRSGAPGAPPGKLWARAWEAKGAPTARRLEFVKGLLALKPEAPPGEKFIYSTSNKLGSEPCALAQWVQHHVFCRRVDCALRGL